MRKRRLSALLLLLAPALARAEFPYPTCGGPLAPACTNPADYESYLASLKGRASISVNSANLEKK